MTTKQTDYCIELARTLKLTGEYDKERRIMYFPLNDAIECEFQPPKK